MLSFKKREKKRKPDSKQEEPLKKVASDPEKQKEITEAPASTIVEPPAEEPELTLPVVPMPKPFYGLQDHVAYFGYSQRGQSHILSDAPCQDRCHGEYLPEKGYLILAVADGVGSCALSDLGANTAVHSVVEHLKKALLALATDHLDSQTAGSLLRSAMQFAYDQVVATAAAFEQLLYSLQSTLTVAIYDGSSLYFAHAGDDGIVALIEDGTLAMASTRHKGEEASSVYPLQEKSKWEFGMVPNTVAFVMATDGVLDAFVRSTYEKNRVYYPFIEPILTADYRSAQDAEQICKDFYNYMSSENYRAVVTDDLTITAAVNVQKISASLPKFDADSWNTESEKYAEQRKQALYHSPASSESGRTVAPAAKAPAPDPQKPNQNLNQNPNQHPNQDPNQKPNQNPNQQAKPAPSILQRLRRRLFRKKKKQNTRKKRQTNQYEPYTNTNAGRDPDLSRSTEPRKPTPKSHAEDLGEERWSILGILIIILLGLFFGLLLTAIFWLVKLFLLPLLSLL